MHITLICVNLMFCFLCAKSSPTCGTKLSTELTKVTVKKHSRSVIQVATWNILKEAPVEVVGLRILRDWCSFEREELQKLFLLKMLNYLIERGKYYFLQLL